MSTTRTSGPPVRVRIEGKVIVSKGASSRRGKPETEPKRGYSAFSPEIVVFLEEHPLADIFSEIWVTNKKGVRLLRHPGRSSEITKVRDGQPKAC